jgi:hypothetical protein
VSNSAHTASADDEELLKQIFNQLKIHVPANPYKQDGEFAEQIRKLPVGLRAMAATHHLDVSLTLDDIGWHFLNFGEGNHVKETEQGLRELGLGEIADLFSEAYAIVLPHLPQIRLGKNTDYYKCLENAGQMDRINELTDKASELLKLDGKSSIYPFWTRYARRHPKNVFYKVD